MLIYHLVELAGFFVYAQLILVVVGFEVFRLALAHAHFSDVPIGDDPVFDIAAARLDALVLVVRLVVLQIHLQSIALSAL